MSIVWNEVLAGASGQAAAEFAIERSLRFNSADSASLSLGSYSGSGTFSCWVKRCELGSAQTIITNVAFAADDTLNGSTAVFRDPSAWMHIVVSSGGTYVNGTSVGSGSAVTPSAIGSGCDLYLAEVYFIDGQSLAATDFGEYDDNNVWQPKAYSGTYGTNGFRLSFSDNTSTTTIAEDSSGNNNDWTANNISVTSGAGNDSMIDTPMNYAADSGNNGGNYCTLNPLDLRNGGTLSNGNLFASLTGATSSANRDFALGTFAASTGKWYFEVTIDSFSNASRVDRTRLGIADPEELVNDGRYGTYYYRANGTIQHDNVNLVTGLSTAGVGDVIGIAYDLDSLNFYAYLNGSANGSTSITAAKYVPIISNLDGQSTTGTYTVNFGQRPFEYTPPTGYLSLVSENRSDPAIADSSTAMDTKLYTGNGSTQTISGLGFGPDLVWIKNRDAADNHQLVDTVRGATINMQSNTTNAESTNADGLTAFNSDGFDLGADDEYNTNSEAYVAWAWDGGTSTVSNTDGTITSSVRASASKGFSIVSYTGNGTSGATVGHGLNAAPNFIIVKKRNAADDWTIYTSARGATKYLRLNLDNAEGDNSNRWNDTEPTSSVFSLGNHTEVNNNGDTYIAYCWTAIDGYCEVGSYEGNGSTDGRFALTKLRPTWLLVKRTDSSAGWVLFDSEREGYNVDNNFLEPNFTDAESTGDRVDIVSNGFKLRTTNAAGNASGGTYIYVAFGDPFKTARAR